VVKAPYKTQGTPVPRLQPLAQVILAAQI